MVYCFGFAIEAIRVVHLGISLNMSYPLISAFFILIIVNGACGQSGSNKSVNHSAKLEITVGKSYLQKLLLLRNENVGAYALVIDSSNKNVYADSNSLETEGFIGNTYKINIPLKPAGWTNDFEFIFTKSQIAILDSLIGNYEKRTTNEIAIVTIDSAWTTKERFDSLVLAIHNGWGVGKKEKNNGIVIGLSAGLRLIRISNGYGIESQLSDADTKKIIDSVIIPDFRQSNFFEGTRQGLLAIMSEVY